MIKCRYPIAATDGTAYVNGYKWGDESLIGIFRDGKVGPWAVTFLPTGTTINSIVEQERYLAPVFLLARIERIETDEWVAFAALAALPFGWAQPPGEIFNWAVEAITARAAQP